MNRRDFLTVGAIGGLTLGGVLSAQASQPEAKAKNVIQIYLPGGMAHQESWIPIPNAPIEFRGPISAIPTKIDGVMFSENLRKTAQIADKITVIRSMTHGEAAHERGVHNMFTAYKPSASLMYPSFGSVVSSELGGRNDLPPYVAIPNSPNKYAGAGYLSSAFGPFSIGGSPEAPGFTVRDLALPNNVSSNRFANRRSIRGIVDEHFSLTEKTDALNGMDTFYSQAYSLISSEKARGAFDMSKESKKTKEKYGLNSAGQRMLLARRLIEGGVRFVTLTYGSWDHHDGIKNGIESQMPAFDQAFAALISDLNDRGLLKDTLVTVSSEFGRTPKINNTAGRDHWPKLFGVALAGGGVKEGFSYGEPDSTATEPEEDPVSPADLGATMYHLMGINPEKTLMASGGRPIEIVKDGRVLKEILT
tara:strand:+ start:1061 stop:2317 length:1257 start_codon:yes stop_codon:yes gene_type:complete